MDIELEKEGLQKVADEEYDEAIDFFTRAIEAAPGNSSLYVNRSAAHLKLENYTDALADANKALSIDPQLSKAYLRKGLACFSLEEFQTAKAAFEAGAALEPTSNQFKTWIRKCEVEIQDENGTSSGPETPNGLGTATDGVEAPASPAPVEVTPEPAPPPPPRYRHEYYQSPTDVVVTIFAKGIKAENLQVDIGEQILSVSIQHEDGEPYILQKRLFGKVITAQSKYVLMGTKIEVRLRKAEAITWTSLDYVASASVVQPINVSDATAEQLKTRYPTSSKKPKNWDKLEADVKKEEKDEKLEGDAALNKLFRDIYSNADEDTRRAMNKSFVESNGTTLSTNWKEVGVAPVVGSAPQGMEMRKWTET